MFNSNRKGITGTLHEEQYIFSIIYQSIKKVAAPGLENRD